MSIFVQYNSKTFLISNDSHYSTFSLLSRWSSCLFIFFLFPATSLPFPLSIFPSSPMIRKVFTSLFFEIYSNCSSAIISSNFCYLLIGCFFAFPFSLNRLIFFLSLNTYNCFKIYSFSFAYYLPFRSNSLNIFLFSSLFLTSFLGYRLSLTSNFDLILLRFSSFYVYGLKYFYGLLFFLRSLQFLPIILASCIFFDYFYPPILIKCPASFSFIPRPQVIPYIFLYQSPSFIDQHFYFAILRSFFQILPSIQFLPIHILTHLISPTFVYHPPFSMNFARLQFLLLAIFSFPSIQFLPFFSTFS